MEDKPGIWDSWWKVAAITLTGLTLWVLIGLTIWAIWAWLI